MLYLEPTHASTQVTYNRSSSPPTGHLHDKHLVKGKVDLLLVGLTKSMGENGKSFTYFTTSTSDMSSLPKQKICLAGCKIGKKNFQILKVCIVLGINIC